MPKTTTETDFADLTEDQLLGSCTIVVTPLSYVKVRRHGRLRAP